MAEDAREDWLLQQVAMAFKAVTAVTPEKFNAFFRAEKTVGALDQFLNGGECNALFFYLDKATLGTPGGATWQGMRVTDTLALGEGFETSAAFTQIHGIPCWATLGAARLDRVHIPDSVTTLIFAEDNDFEGRRARRKAWAAYRPRGLTLKRMPPPSRYGDWADVVKPGA